MSTNATILPAKLNYDALALNIKAWGRELGFQQVGITGIQLDREEVHLMDWLERGRHGSMTYMARHGKRRSRPADPREIGEQRDQPRPPAVSHVEQ